MEKQFTNTQKELLKMLNTMSNGVSNCVYMAEEVEGSNIDEKIESAIWFAEYHLEEIKKIKKSIAEKNVQTTS